MRELRGAVRHRAHEPVRRRLPHRVKQAACDVQHHATDVRPVVDVDLVVSGCGD